jgi:hypothetical protein
MGGLVTSKPSKISLLQFCTMSTFHMAQTLLMETVLLEEKKLQYSHIDSIENNDSIFVLVA